MGKYFGTDGFRGEAGITLTADHAYKVGRFLGWYYNALRERNGDTDPARIVIGKDTRRSSYMFEYSLVAGLTASGADAYLLHVTTTPSVAYIARVDDFDCGIMISASHNPYYDNGIKLIDCYGEKMPEETLLLVEDYIDGKLHVFDKDWPELPFARREHIGCTVDYVAGRNRYMGYLISLGIYSFKGVKVGLDCANGSSWNIAKSVFDALGADTYVINNKPNGTNINNNAGSTHIEGLQKFVVEKGLDVGFAFDGDADRCLCVDEKGNGKARPQYDHFFPKSFYPYLALSMYNLIPSCAVCNGGKSNADSFKDQKVQYLNPYVEGYGTKTVLQITPKKKKDRIHSYVGLAEEYTVKPESAPDVDKDAAKRIQNTWDLLKLGPLYEKHSDYIRNILRAKQIYTEEYLDQLMKSFPGAFDDMDDLKNVVYFNYLDEEDWGKRILAKLTHDLEVENS